MKAMILAAGLGSRLHPITHTIPKPMIPLAGTPNIAWIIEHLRRNQITDIAINLHHLPDAIPRYLGDGTSLGVRLCYSVEKDLLGTAGGIRKMFALVPDDTVVVINGDVLFMPQLIPLVNAHKQQGHLATMIVRRSQRAKQLGAVGLDPSHRVRRLVWAGDTTVDASYMFTGMHILNPDILSLLPQKGCIVRHTYIPMVTAATPVLGGIPVADWFCDLGTPGDYIDATAAILTRQRSLPGYIPPEQEYLVDPSAHIGPGATIHPGCYVGRNAAVASGVTVTRSIIMPDAIATRDVSNAIVCSDGTILRGTESCHSI